MIFAIPNLAHKHGFLMINTNIEKNISKAFIIIATLTIISLILWNTSVFFERLKQVERDKMEIWAQSQKSFISNEENDYLELNLLINTSNNKIPIVNINENGEVNLHSNIPDLIVENPENFAPYIEKLKSENKPIIIKLPDGKKQYLYYGNSTILKKLKYYPLAITLIIFLLGGVVYFFLATSKASEQNKLWAGMAKETAHQIGTPLSSLVGWMEILRTENVDPDYIIEIEKDITRLNIITERFSKIGSIPDLEVADIIHETQEAYSYLKARSSKLINFSLNVPQKQINVKLNTQLFSWTIENLVKNAIDAMKGRGDLHISIIEKNTFVKIQVTDSGKGIPKRNFNKVFAPGYTSKKRGWGLGLSLAKRIIVDYHKGRINVQHSEIDKGTTFQITLNKC